MRKTYSGELLGLLLASAVMSIGTSASTALARPVVEIQDDLSASGGAGPSFLAPRGGSQSANSRSEIASLPTVIPEDLAIRVPVTSLELAVTDLPAGYQWIAGAWSKIVEWIPIAELGAESGTADAEPTLQDPLASLETISLDVSGLDKWEVLERRQNAQSKTVAWTAIVAKARQSATSGLLAGINALVNGARYVNDPRDRWETPVELFHLGGDCEDYAIAKYMLLRELGVLTADMRIVMLAPTRKAVGHAVLVVATSEGPMVLDNLHAHAYPIDEEILSRTVYAFNDTGWWMSRGTHPVVTASK